MKLQWKNVDLVQVALAGTGSVPCASVTLVIAGTGIVVSQSALATSSSSSLSTYRVTDLNMLTASVSYFYQ